MGPILQVLLTPHSHTTPSLFFRAQAEAIETELKMREMSVESKPQSVYSADLNLFNQGVKLSAWQYK